MKQATLDKTLQQFIWKTASVIWYSKSIWLKAQGQKLWNMSHTYPSGSTSFGLVTQYFHWTTRLYRKLDLMLVIVPLKYFGAPTEWFVDKCRRSAVDVEKGGPRRREKACQAEYGLRRVFPEWLNPSGRPTHGISKWDYTKYKPIHHRHRKSYCWLTLFVCRRKQSGSWLTQWLTSEERSYRGPGYVY